VEKTDVPSLARDTVTESLARHSSVQLRGHETPLPALDDFLNAANLEGTDDP
jgi:hypothetical protein